MDGDIKFSYETLWKFIIRPPRDEYTESMLGKKIFKYNSKHYERKDYDIMSTQGYILKCSFIEPTKAYRPSVKMPVVVYLHGNSSSRIEGLNMTKVLLKRDINLFVFDFAGSGLSEGEYISLGYHESDDVGNIIDFLEKIPGVGKIGIWGRSMGAATGMIYAHRDKRIRAMCLDSPFADFERLAKELTKKNLSFNLPGFIIGGMLSIVRGTILKKNGLDIDKLKPIDVASKTTQPIIFVHAIKDELIDVKHSMDLFNMYGGQQKSLKCCENGGHNSKRDSSIILDNEGAQDLTANGDMLFLPFGEKYVQRIKCCYIKNDEILRLVDFITKQYTSNYEEIYDKPADNSILPNIEEEKLYEKAVEFVVQTKKASASLLQRKFKIGYNRAARLIDLLEERGIIGPQQGSKPREVMVEIEKKS